MKKTVLLAFVFFAFLIVFLSLAMVMLYIKPEVAEGTVYIRADGSIEPSTAPISSVDNVNYTLTGNIFNGSIVVERDNIVVDGAGYTLKGTWKYTIPELWEVSKGIDLTGRSNVTIMNMKIKAFGDGIWLKDSSSNNISGNSMTNNGAGIHLYASSNNTISGNTIADNARGVHLEFSSFNTISGNKITNNKEVGIKLTFSSSNNISKNTIINKKYGILFFESYNNSVFENSITNNNYGIYCQFSSNNTIYHNDFIGNRKHQPSSLYSTNIWDTGTEGNYWSNYTGEDQNGDGIGDTPYVVDENNRDNYPLMSRLGPPPPPLWTQLWFWTIIVVGIVVLVVAVYLLKTRKPPTPTAPTLPTEGTPRNIHCAYSCHSHLQTTTTQNTKPLNSYLRKMLA